MGITSINGLLLKKMIIAGANKLNSEKQLVDSLNVFPVPDGDTGTNMSLTVIAAAREIEKNNSLNIGEIAKAAANGALRGARGNSGVITSQLFRGFYKGLEGKEEANTKDIALAIAKGVKTAYKAVMKPKEGTILTVARACAESAEKYADEITDIEKFIEQILEDGNAMLLQTTDMLPALKQANVVDAGGKGLLFILQGAYENIHTEGEITVDEPLKTQVPDFSAITSVDNDSITFGYCTEFFINVNNADNKIVTNLKAYLGTIGDSIVCVADDDIIKIHVHTDHPGLALEKALTIGSLSGLKIENMREQHTNIIDFGGNKKSEAPAPVEKKDEPPKEIGFISVSVGSGLSDIFKNLGVDEIIEGGQTMNPSTEDILNAVENINAKNIIVLPNNKNIILAAEQAAKLSKDKKVFVVPSKTIPEGITAMINFNPAESVDSNVSDMTESLSTVKTAMVTYAVRETSIDDKQIEEGDILGMLGGNIAVVSKDLIEGTKELIDKAVDDDSEMISVYYGSDVKEDEANEIAAYIEEKYPDCEVEVQLGNQPLYYYIISVE